MKSQESRVKEPFLSLKPKCLVGITSAGNRDAPAQPRSAARECGGDRHYERRR